jgi:hypothetical protein
MINLTTSKQSTPAVGLGLAMLLLGLSGGDRGIMAQAISQPKSIPAPFQAIAAELQAVTQVPLRLPTRLPLTKEAPPLYATVTVRNRTEYEIILGLSADCGGGNACRWGTLSGQQLTPNTPSIARQFADYTDPSYQPWTNLPPEIKKQFGPVKLTRGLSGFFVPATCGANCGDSMVLWEQNGFRYMVGIKVGKLKEVIDLANSAIENQR